MPELDVKSGEVVISLIHEHWVKYVRPVFIFALLMIAVVFFFYIGGVSVTHYEWLSDSSFLLGVLLLFVTFHWFFAMLLSKSVDHIVITNRRVVQVRTLLFFYEDMNEISFDKVKTVDAQKNGFWQNILSFGTLIFENKYEITLVPHPTRAAKDIEQAMGRR